MTWREALLRRARRPEPMSEAEVEPPYRSSYESLADPNIIKAVIELILLLPRRAREVVVEAAITRMDWEAGDPDLEPDDAEEDDDPLEENGDLESDLPGKLDAGSFVEDRAAVPCRNDDGQSRCDAPALTPKDR